MKTKAQILVVDDNPVMLKFLHNLLSEHYEVVSKVSAISAFRWLEEGNYPSLIISDLMTPGMDNMSFVKNLKISGFYRDTPIILLSAVLKTGQVFQAPGFKIDAFFSKPFNPVKLKDTIGELISVKYHATTA